MAFHCPVLMLFTLLGCSLVADIGVWIDSSGSISRSDFSNAQRVVRGIVSGFGVSDSGVHISVGSFSDRVSYTRLDESNDASAVIQDLERLPRLGGYTFTDLALETWGSEVFTDRGGARSGEWGLRTCRPIHFVATVHCNVYLPLCFFNCAQYCFEALPHLHFTLIWVCMYQKRTYVN